MILTLGEGDPELEGSGHYVAENAVVIGRVRMKSDSSIWFGTVVRGDNELIEIGERSNVQDGCVLHTDPGEPIMIGDDVTIGHMVMLHGCTVRDGSLVGIGSVIMNGAEIGEQSIVGANSLVTEGKVFAPRSLIVGSPARSIRELSDVEVAGVLETSSNYVRNAQRYVARLRELKS
jgi:carbonic anhydrase/acetyltransferase-like protein (isoleucine patch superfamily)